MYIIKGAGFRGWLFTRTVIFAKGATAFTSGPIKTLAT
jgi:hypothetical protein